MNKIIVIGAGFSGLAAASIMAKQGHEVILLEKNDQAGGRARQFSQQGFVFDMGPSWYWMPEVFEQFYNRFSYTTSDFYELKRLDPSYKVFFPDNELAIPAGEDAVTELFESLEAGSAKKLQKFLKSARYKYEVGMKEYVWKPGYGITEFIDLRVLKSIFRMQMLSSISKEVRNLFKDPRIIKILEFPVLFLGASPQQTPAMYSLMNYADICLGTWYPMGGMHEIAKAFEQIALEQGVEIRYNHEVHALHANGKRLLAAQTIQDTIEAEYFLSAADYQYVDQKLLPRDHQNYNAEYWDKRDLAPSSLLYYIGVDQKIEGLEHHNLFFDRDFTRHTDEIYENAGWPVDPLFYVCCPSKTDPSVAPAGAENLFILIPLAPGLEDDEIERAKCFEKVMNRLERRTGQNIRSHIKIMREFGPEDFKRDYHAFKGNAYGLANTLRQTAFLKPSIKHKSLENLYFTGQMTTPGPGVPPSIISGQLVAGELLDSIQ